MILNYKELFLQNVRNALLSVIEDVETIEKVSQIVILELNKYDLSKVCTDLVKVDTSSENILKLYRGTLLTEGRSEETVYGYLRVITRFMDDLNKPLTEMGVFDIRVWLAKMQSEVSLRTCENYRSYLSAFYTWMANEEFVAKNPMLKVKPIKFVDKIKQPFTDVEVDALRSSCKTLRERAELELLISSGARVSELANLNKDDIDLQSLEVCIRNGKGKKSRTTYINEVCTAHLKNYLNSRTDDNESLFVSKLKERISDATVRDDLKRIGKRAGVGNTHPHRCRRTFATNMVKRGMDIQTIQTLLGHTNLDTTMMYVSLNKEFIQNEYRRLG